MLPVDVKNVTEAISRDFDGLHFSHRLFFFLWNMNCKKKGSTFVGYYAAHICIAKWWCDGSVTLRRVTTLKREDHRDGSSLLTLFCVEKEKPFTFLYAFLLDISSSPMCGFQFSSCSFTLVPKPILPLKTVGMVVVLVVGR